MEKARSEGGGRREKVRREGEGWRRQGVQGGRGRGEGEE